MRNLFVQAVEFTQSWRGICKASRFIRLATTSIYGVIFTILYICFSLSESDGSTILALQHIRIWTRAEMFFKLRHELWSKLLVSP